MTEHGVSVEMLVGLLEEGAEAFNEWRRANPRARVDLAGVSLEHMNLDGVFFSGAHLDGTSLSFSSFRGAVFSGASLESAQLIESDLRGATFGPPDLVDSELSLSPLGDRLMYGATLTGTVFERCELGGASFRECDLGSARFIQSDLDATDLRNANLEGAHIEAPAPDPHLPRLREQPFPIRRSVMQSVLLLVLADGHVSLDEQDWVSGMAHQLGLDQAALDELSPRGRVVLDEFPIEAPADAEAKTSWMRVLLALVEASTHAEGGVSHDELNVVGHVGRALGYSSQEIAAMLSEKLGIQVGPAHRS